MASRHSADPTRTVLKVLIGIIVALFVCVAGVGVWLWHQSGLHLSGIRQLSSGAEVDSKQ